MPRPTDHAKSIASSVSELLSAVTGLVGCVHAAVASSSGVRTAAGDVKKAAGEVGGAVSQKTRKLRRALKGYWGRLKGKKRLERIRKMLAGRGLKPKRKKAVRKRRKR